LEEGENLWEKRNADGRSQPTPRQERGGKGRKNGRLEITLGLGGDKYGWAASDREKKN